MANAKWGRKNECSTGSGERTITDCKKSSYGFHFLKEVKLRWALKIGNIWKNNIAFWPEGRAQAKTQRSSSTVWSGRIGSRAERNPFEEILPWMDLYHYITLLPKSHWNNREKKVIRLKPQRKGCQQ